MDEEEAQYQQNLPEAPKRISDALKAKYPKPTIDPEWMKACYAYVRGEVGVRPGSNMEELIDAMDRQLLFSELVDSTVPNTGLPPNINDLHATKIAANGAILCQIVAITEIGQSAFTLQSTHQAREDQADLADRVQAGLEDEEEAEGISKYPRAMLKLVLSDGSVSLRAIEYRRLPDLELGETQLGCKVLLKNVPIRRGLALLDPTNTIIFKESSTEEREEWREKKFVWSLRSRLRHNSPEPGGETFEGMNGMLNGPRGAAIVPGPPPQVPPPRPAQPIHPPNQIQPAQPPAQPRGDGPDDSFDFDDSFDDAFLQELATLERSHLADMSQRTAAPSQRRRGAELEAIDLDSDVEMEDTQPASTLVASNRTQNGGTFDDDIIEISD